MYFDASKKNYYRFPSINSVNQMDSKYYFPERPYSSGENSHLQSRQKGPGERDRSAIFK